jgi:ectoine hydroxylase-related dioxygenase (phytanoyl-CoA dioxygenase family)
VVNIELQPGEFSLHHVRIVHGSDPNPSDQRRIGFAIRYVPTYLKQTAGPRDSAMLVRGVDHYHHFEMEPRPRADMHPDALAMHKRVTEEAAKILYRGTDKQPG